MRRFSKHFGTLLLSTGAVFSLVTAAQLLHPETVFAKDTTAKIHVLALDGDSNAVLLESVDQNGQKIFGMVDSGEDHDYPNGSDPKYPLRHGIITNSGFDEQVTSYLDSVGVTSDNLLFYVATHPHSDHVGTADTIIEKYFPKRVYLLPYEDDLITQSGRLWDNLYVYDSILSSIQKVNDAGHNVELIQHLDTGYATPEEGNPAFSLGNFQIQIVNYDEDYLESPKEDINQFCLGVIASANGHRAFLPSDMDNTEKTSGTPGDLDRVVSTYDLHNIDFMTSNHHGYDNAMDPDYLNQLKADYFIQTGHFRLMTAEKTSLLAGLGSRIFSTQAYCEDVPAIIADFSGSAVSTNVDGTYQIYQNSNRQLCAYYNGMPYHGIFEKNGHSYYADENGLLYVSTSWQDPSSGILYTFNEKGQIINSVSNVGWKQENGNWYYTDASGSRHVGWLTVDGKTYYCDKNGIRVTKWQKIDGTWYWFEEDGTMKTGWLLYDKNWYFLDKNTGAMYENGWHPDPDTKTMYYFYSWGGIAKNTTLTLDGYRVKFLNWGGISGSTWLKMDGKWYYVKKYSCVTNCWQKINNVWYYFNQDGSMKCNEAFEYDHNLYFVDRSGKMYSNQWVKWNNTWYYVYSWGGAMKNRWLFYKNNWYYLTADCSMQTGWATIDGKTYYFRDWGGRVTGKYRIDGKEYEFDSNGILLS